MTALAISNFPRLAQDTDDSIIAMWLHGRGKNTRRAYQSDIERLRKHTPGPLAHVTLKNLQDFADSLSGADASKRRTLCAVKSLFTFAHGLGYLPFDTARPLKVKSMSVGVKPQRILSEAQVKAMLDNEPGLRNYIMLRLLYVTGIRVAELVTLKWSDCIDRENGQGQITITGKREKIRSIIVPAAIWRELMSLRQTSERIFDLDPSTVWSIVRAAAERAGITAGVSTHWLRHSLASHALQNGASLALVQATLGHASIRTTAMYLHARPNESAGQYLNV